MAYPQTQHYNENNTKSLILLVDTTLVRYQVLQSRKFYTLWNITKHVDPQYFLCFIQH